MKLIILDRYKIYFPTKWHWLFAPKYGVYHLGFILFLTPLKED